jgi:hypothetical protein
MPLVNEPGPQGRHHANRPPISPFKYTVTRNDGGKPIPSDEPCLVIRAQDAFALPILQMYINHTLDAVSPALTNELLAHRERIRRWQEEHRDRVKLPD